MGKRKTRRRRVRRRTRRGGSDYEGLLLPRQDNEKGSDSFTTY